jgi:hypothetical protein
MELSGSVGVTFPSGAVGNSALMSGTAQNSTSGTSIDFTSIPSWVKRITVMFNGVSTNGTSNFLIQIGDSGGIENTGYSSCGTTLAGSTLTTSAFTAGFGIGDLGSQTAASTYNGFAMISLVDSSAWTFNAQVAGVGQNHLKIGAGAKTLSSAPLTQLRITTSNGTDTFDAGSINILYE